VRGVLVVAAILVLAVLAVIQLASDGLYAHAAVPGSLPRSVPREFGIRVYDRLASIGFPPYARRIAALAAIEDGRFDRARTLIDGLPPGVDRDDAQARLDDALGDHRRAVARYVAAGDLVRVSEAVDALDRAGRAQEALAIGRALVRELERLRDVDDLAHAYWRLGQLESETGHHRASLAAYRRALVYEPLSETYLLGAANEEMGHGDLASARALFARVVALDPGSVDGHIGVGRVALRSGDIAGARREIAIVHRLAPASPQLAQFESEVRNATSR